MRFLNLASAMALLAFIPHATLAQFVSISAVDFGEQPIMTSSEARGVTITNSGAASSFSVSTSEPFSVSHSCTQLSAGQSCTAQVSFRPTATGVYVGALTIRATSGRSALGAVTQSLPLRGTGQRSLVTHYYRSILNRAPDEAGKAFWETEASRLSALGANINETWFAMAAYFFNSPEYIAANKSNTAFVTDLYNTFFNRAPDGSGLSYWVGQIDAGLPREIVLISFMFSSEFRTFTQAIFGSTEARPEIDLVMDFFRGVLSRLPDSPSFNYWVGRLRTAQCQGTGPVYGAVDEISAAFVYSPEYGSRQRTSTQFVSDMYYSFLRRGADRGGFYFWVNELVSGRSGEQIRRAFIDAPEFGGRVAATAAAGCVQLTAGLGTTAADGRALLRAGGVALPIKLIDSITGSPLSGLAASAAYDPTRPGRALLMISDRNKEYPLQIVHLESLPPAVAAQKVDSELMVSVRRDPTQQVLTAVVQTLRTGLLGNVPPPEPNATDFRNLLLKVVKELSDAEQLFVPPGLSPVLPSDEISEPIPVDQYRTRLEQETAAAMLGSYLQWLIELPFPHAWAPPLLSANGLYTSLATGTATALFPIALRQFLTSVYEDSGATAVILHKVKAGGLVVVFPEGVFANGRRPVFPTNPNATCEVRSIAGAPIAGSSLDLISTTSLGMGIRTVLDSQGRGTFPIPTGTYQMRAEALGFAPRVENVTVSSSGLPCNVTLTPTNAAFCSFALVPDERFAPARTSIASFDVVTPQGCAWSAHSDSPTWISITAGNGGSGNGQVTYVVANSSNGTRREGHIVVGQRIFKVTQAAFTTGNLRLLAGINVSKAPNGAAASVFSTADSLYVNFTVINPGTMDLPGTRGFNTELFVNGELRRVWLTNPPFNANSQLFSSANYSLGSLPAGDYTLRVSIDRANLVDEDNEQDNEYSTTFTVSSGPPTSGPCSYTLCHCAASPEIPSSCVQPTQPNVLICPALLVGVGQSCQVPGGNQLGCPVGTTCNVMPSGFGTCGTSCY